LTKISFFENESHGFNVLQLRNLLKRKKMFEKFNRFGWIAIILLVVGCLGGLTVGMGAIESTWALIIILIPTMLTLSFLLSVAPMKWIAVATIATVSIDLVLFSYYLSA
jgi:fatty acid desaturase